MGRVDGHIALATLKHVSLVVEFDATVTNP
jgi:hypothetical protein